MPRMAQAPQKSALLLPPLPPALPSADPGLVGRQPLLPE